MSNNTVTWAQLAPGQQEYLSALARVGKEWVNAPFIIRGIDVNEYHALRKMGLFESRLIETGVQERITPAGLAVWQQGQVATAPRSVWVARWHEYGEGDYLLSIHAKHETAQAACEAHTEQALEWQHTVGFDGLGEYRARACDDNGDLRGEYFVHEMPVLQ